MLYYLGGLVALIGAIWLAVNAFRNDGVLHGIFALICGLYTLWYGATRFSGNEAPFFMFIGGTLLAFLLRPY